MKLYVSLPQGDTWGWGVCGKNIIKALKKRDDIEIVDDPFKEVDASFLCVNDIFLKPYLFGKNEVVWYGSIKHPIIGYCFFEEELPDEAIENAKHYDLILTGSTWCMEKLKVKGINHVDVLLQGVDLELFYPCEKRKEDSKFILYSGGKFEYRKGQDIVLAAFKLLQDKYPNLELATNWSNPWEFSINTMERSEYIAYKKSSFENLPWRMRLAEICEMNGIYEDRVHDIGVIPNEKMREVYAQTDLGLFPNRCEGGTNLVLMEYMACGRPVLANHSTGQKDVLGKLNSYSFTPEELTFYVEIEIDFKKGEGDEHNSSIQNMDQFTWNKTVDNLINFVKFEIEQKRLDELLK